MTISCRQTADGTTGFVGGFTAVTGTGGAAFPSNVVVGNMIDVICLNNGSASATYSCADNLGNTYNQIDSGVADNRQWVRFQAEVTTGGACTITGTCSVQFNQRGIAAAELTGVSTSTPFNSGNVAHSLGVGSGTGVTDGQTSGLTPTLTVQPAAVCGWGYSESNAGGIAAGTGFTGQSALWGGFGTATLVYEVKNLSALTAVAATYTPPSGQTVHTLAAVFNAVGPTTFRAASQASAGNSTNNVTVNAPVGLIAGDVLIAGFVSSNVSGVAPPAGWALIDTETDGSTWVAGLYLKVAGASEPSSYTFTTSGTNGDKSIVMGAYYNAAGTIAVYSKNNPGGYPGSPVTMTGDSITTSSPSTILWLSTPYTSASGGTWAAPAAMTLRTSATGVNTSSAALADFTQGSAGVVANQSGTWTITGGNAKPNTWLIALAPFTADVLQAQAIC